jgi:hypothetical protein
MEQPQQPRYGKAAARPLPRRLAERALQGRSTRHGASRAIDEKGAMAMPPSFVQGGWLHGTPETLEEAGEEVEREFGTRLTVGRCTEPQARQMGQMTTGGMAMPHLPQEARHGGDWRQHAVAPCGRLRASAWTRSASRASRRGVIPTPVENFRHRPTAQPFPPPPPHPPHAAHGRLPHTLVGWRRAWSACGTVHARVLPCRLQGPAMGTA